MSTARHRVAARPTEGATSVSACLGAGRGRHESALDQLQEWHCAETARRSLWQRSCVCWERGSADRRLPGSVTQRSDRVSAAACQQYHLRNVTSDKEETTVCWTPGNALEELWTTNCNKEVGSYVFFRGKIGENTVFCPSQVDAVRQAGTTELVELKLGRIHKSRLYQTFVQCHFKGLQSVDYVEQAFPCKFYDSGRCRKGSDCGFAHEFKKTSSDARPFKLFAPATFGRDMYSLDMLLTQLEGLVEIERPSILVVDKDGSMVLHSEIEMKSPWMEIPSFFREICFV